MHDMTSIGARGALSRYEVIPVKGGNIRESIPGDSQFQVEKPEGESCVFDMLGGVADERYAYPDLSRRSEQLSWRKYFNPSYGLFNINFKSFNSFLN